MSREYKWKEFFDHHASIYMENVFTRNTLAEVDFLLEELALAPASRILDVGCGTGRHTVELARRGFIVAGIDLSSGMLAEAKKAADQAGVLVELIQANATNFKIDEKFNAAICLCEGAFSLLEPDDDPLDHDLAILRNINDALKSNGRLILTALNGLEKARKFTQHDIDAGRFDPATLVETYTMEYDLPEGKKSVIIREKGYIGTELSSLLRMAGFETMYVWGGTAGNWGRRPIDPDEIELMIVARKASIQRSHSLTR